MRNRGTMILGSGSRWHFHLAALSLLAGSLVAGCDSADYTVLKKVNSPEVTVSALLVQRRGHDSLSSDVYYVVLLDSKDQKPSLAKATLVKAFHGKPILVATNGEGLGIQWSGPYALSITCADCGMREIDMIERNEMDGAVRITYIGVPNKP